MLTAAACQQFKVDTQMTPEKFAQSVKLVCDAQENYTVAAANPSAIIFSVSSNAAWTINGMPEWLSVSPSSSGVAGLISDVTVVAKDYEGLEDRTAVITVSNDEYDTPSYSITIHQNRMGALTVQPVSDDFKAIGNTKAFTIDANYDWKLRSSEAWLTFDVTEGEAGFYTINATAAKSEVLERSAVVTIASGDDEESFEVCQKGMFELTEIGAKYTDAGGDQTLTIVTDLPWKVMSDKNWLSFDKTSGIGDGNSIEIKANATANDDASRKAVVTVIAGDAKKTFEVEQKGFTFNIVAPEDPSIASKGGELLVEVAASVDWKVSSSDDLFAVEKVDASHFKVVAGWNNIFIPRKATITIEAPNGTKDQIEVSQDINFTFSGKCEVLSDGSVKLDGSDKSRVYLKDNYRYVNVKLTFGEKNFGSKGECWFSGKIGECNFYNQITLGGNIRIRTDGNMKNGVSSYANTKYEVTQDELNAMDTYEIRMSEKADGHLDVVFLINGTEKAHHNSELNPYYYDESDVNYYFGMNTKPSDGTWYIIKSCELTAIPE